jgi:hypothetical protein
VKFGSEIEKCDYQFAIIHMNTKKTQIENDKATGEGIQEEQSTGENDYCKKLRKPEERKTINCYEAYLADDCDCITMKSDDKSK